MLHDWYDTVNAGTTEMVMVDSPISSAEMGEEILAGIKAKIEEEKYQSEQETPVRHFQWWYAAAAILLLIAGTITYRTLNTDPNPQMIVSNILPTKEVVAPQTARAVITLANGNKLFLDSMSNGTVAMQGNIRVIKRADGELIYSRQGFDHVTQYNVLMVPRGSRVVNLTLTDGTRVWLNAESSMRYPVAFNGNSRKVEITGEGYFEVAKDPSKRFYVSSRGLTTEVLEPIST